MLMPHKDKPLIVTLRIEQNEDVLYNQRMTIERGAIEIETDPVGRGELGFNAPIEILPKPKIDIRILGTLDAVEFLSTKRRVCK